MLVESIDPESRQIANLKRKIRLEKFFIILSLAVIHDVVDQGLHPAVV